MSSGATEGFTILETVYSAILFSNTQERSSFINTIFYISLSISDVTIKYLDF